MRLTLEKFTREELLACVDPNVHDLSYWIETVRRGSDLREGADLPTQGELVQAAATLLAADRICAALERMKNQQSSGPEDAHGLRR